MSSMFEFDAKLRRLRETLSYLRNMTLSDAAGITDATKTGADPRAREDWLKFIAELHDFLTAAEALAPSPKRAKRAVRKLLSGGEIAEVMRAGATLH